MSDRILVVDDDPQITTFLKRYLEKQGFAAECVATGKAMKKAIETSKVDLCILDVGLPDADGFELTRQIRAHSNLPIIVLSVRDEAFDRVFGLEYGADDYVTKPFEPRELVARIRSVLRRTRTEDGESRGPAVRRQDILQFGNWDLNAGQRTLVDRKSGVNAELTSMEFDLLRILVKNAHVVLSRDQLLDEVRGRAASVGDRAIDVHIMRLRKKIEEDPANPRFVKTVHGVGYSFAEDVKQAS